MALLSSIENSLSLNGYYEQCKRFCDVTSEDIEHVSTSSFLAEPDEDSDQEFTVDEHLSPYKLCDKLSCCYSCHEPRFTGILKCGHQFCYGCLREIADKYYCERCNEWTATSDLVDNYPCNRLLGGNAGSQAEASDNVTCRVHHLNANIFCVICNCILCELCAEVSHKDHSFRLIAKAPDIIDKEITHQDTMCSILRARLNMIIRQLGKVATSRGNLIKDLQRIPSELHLMQGTV